MELAKSLRSAGFVMVLMPALLLARENGPEPRRTGGPGDDPLACATAGCHTANRNGGPINFHGGSVKAVFSTGDLYYPGIPVTITVTVTDPDQRRFGFQMTARLGSDPLRQAGTFTAGNSSTFVLCENDSPRRGESCPAASPVEFIEQSAAATTPWKFTWTPSPSQSGPVRFFLAGNAVNFNGRADEGDHVYTAEYTLNPAVCPQVQPQITSVTSGSDFGGLPNISAGSWIEIKGTNLATSTRIWEDRDFLYANAPGSIDGVRATVSDRPAFVYYVSPTQINVQAPTDPLSGMGAPIRVTNCQGTSDAFSVQKTARAPGLLAHPLWRVGGRQFLTALHQDGRTFVGNPGMVGDVPMRPARPGDSLTAYGIGFGDVLPARVALTGVVVSELNSLASSFSITLGTTAVSSVSYAGLAPGFVGLYQFNFVIPEVPDGEHQLNMTLAGVALQQTPVFVIVRR